MTGSAADADDLVQETLLRALERGPADSTTPLMGWLVKVAVNLSRDHLRRRKRETYRGPWLPSPVRSEGISTREGDAEARYGALESISSAFLVALEALLPTQRAVVLLCDVLGYSVREAASALERSESNVKTTHHRARAALAKYDASRRPIDAAAKERTQAALGALMLGFAQGDVAALERLLASDVCARNDSGGEFHAAGVPVFGRTRVIKFHLGIQRHSAPRLALCELNGLPALLGEFDEQAPRLAPRFAFQIALDQDGRVCVMDTIVASAKLKHLFQA